MRQFFSAVFLTFFLSACGQHAKQFNRVSYMVEFQYMENCEMGKGDCHPIQLTRRSIGDTITVTYPNGGTQTDVYLYVADSAFMKWMNGTPKDRPKLLLHVGKFLGQGNPVFDLTGLPDGKYISHMVSCNVGGFLQLVIQTKD
jgi:hypothetical protein